MNQYMQLDPPVTIDVVGNHRLYGVGQGGLVGKVLDHIGSKHAVQLTPTIVPGLGRQLYSWGSAATRWVNIIIANNSCLGMCELTVPLRKGNLCSTQDHLDLATDAPSRTPETAFLTISGSSFKPKTVLAVHTSTANKATSLSTPAPANSGIRSWVIPMGR